MKLNSTTTITKIGIAFFISLCFFQISSCSKSFNKNKMDHQVNVTISSDYCGGARPTPEIMEALSKPIPYENGELYLYTSENKKGTAIKVKTNEKGEIVTKIEAGIYYVYLPQKITTTNPQEANTDCADWLRTHDTILEITKNNKVTNIHIHKTCNPCGPQRP